MVLKELRIGRTNTRMQGLKTLLLGFMFILIGGFILIDPSSSFGGIGEVILFAIGISLGIAGLKKDD